MNDNRFTFEKLEVYQMARAALAIGVRCRAGWRGLPGEVASQLDRSLVSVVANICEGAGRESRADRKRHFAIARGSATEAGGLVEVALLYGALGEADHAALRMALLRVTWMLTALLR